MEEWVGSYEILKEQDWNGSLKVREGIFMMKEEIDKLLGLETNPKIEANLKTETEAEAETDTDAEAAQENKSEGTVGDEGMKDWGYGPVVDKAREEVFASFDCRKLGLHDVSEFYLNWSIDQQLWRRLIQSQPGFEGFEFPWPHVTGFSVPPSWHAHFTEQQRWLEGKLSTSKAVQNNKDPWMTNPEYERMVVVMQKKKESGPPPKIKIRVKDDVKGEVELNAESTEQREERVKIMTTEMMGVVERVKEMEEKMAKEGGSKTGEVGEVAKASEDVKAGQTAESGEGVDIGEDKKPRSILVFRGCQPYELPLERDLASLVPPRDVAWINFRLPSVLTMLREDLGAGRVKLVFKIKDGLSLNGGMGGSNSDQLNLVWSRVLHWKYRMSFGIHYISLMNMLVEHSKRSVYQSWIGVEDVFGPLQARWEDDQDNDTSCMDAKWLKTMKYGLLTAIHSMDSMIDHSVEDQVRAGIDWALSTEELTGTIPVRCWGAVECLGTGGADFRLAAIQEAHRRSIWCPMGLCHGQQAVEK